MAGPHPLRLKGIDHVVLKVTDIERSLRFYVEVLGMSLERVIEDFGIFQLRCGSHLIDLELQGAGTALAPPAQRGIAHLCLMLEAHSVDIRAHLAAHAVAISAGPVEIYGATGFGTSVYVDDPDGYSIELKSMHTESPQRVRLRDAPPAAASPAAGG